MTTTNGQTEYDAKAAQALYDALYTLNLTDPNNETGSNGFYASQEPDRPYGLVYRAWQMMLVRLTKTVTSIRVAERAEQLGASVWSNGESVLWNVDRIEPEWKYEDTENRYGVFQELADYFGERGAVDKFTTLGVDPAVTDALLLRYRVEQSDATGEPHDDTQANIK